MGLSNLKLVSFAEVMSKDLPPVDWLVSNLIANQDRVMVYGASGAFKSWLLLDLGLAIASGKPWLGQFGVPKPKNVLYVDEEMNERTLRHRVKRLGGGCSHSAGDVPFKMLSMSGLTLGMAEDATNFLQRIQEQGFDPDVLIFETLRRIMKGSELNADDVAAFWKAVQPFVVQGKTVIIAHHMRKHSPQGNNDVKDRASGSTYILGGADTAFAVTRQGRDSRVVIDCAKNRNMEEPAPFAACLQGEDDIQSLKWVCEEQHCNVASINTKQGKAYKLILSFLQNKGAGFVRPKDIKEFVMTTGISEKTFERAWRAVKENDTLEEHKDGWRLRQQLSEAA